MNHTLRQRSQLVIAAERGIRNEQYRRIGIRFALVVVLIVALGVML